MTINKFNYEAYALDYLEGQLSPDEAAMMERFLDSQPVVRAELESMREWTTVEPDETVVFSDKEVLYRREEALVRPIGWRRPLLAAACVGLLFLVYRTGYRAGLNANDTTPIVAMNNERVPSVEELVREKQVVDNQEVASEDVVPLSTDRNVAARTGGLSSPTPSNRPTGTPRRRSTTKPAVNPTLAERSAAVQTSGLGDVPPLNRSRVASFDHDTVGPPNHNTRKYQKINLPQLPNRVLQPLTLDETALETALASNLEIRTDWPVRHQPSFRIQDLFGRFPINDLKEAVIPTFYRENENVGQ